MFVLTIVTESNQQLEIVQHFIQTEADADQIIHDDLYARVLKGDALTEEDLLEDEESSYVQAETLKDKIEVLDDLLESFHDIGYKTKVVEVPK